MIRYSLLCEDAHDFEAWFRDSAAFDQQSERGEIGCPQCGSSNVRKALMAPSIRRSSRSGTPAPVAPPEVPAAPPEVPVAFEGPAKLDEEKFRQLRSMIRELHSRVKAQAEDVGRTFPEEARKISDGDAPGRAIYGTATPEEVSSLLEDGIDVLPLPPLPDERN
jgi:hypothetical protein